jgi:hypothetical protein
MFGSLASSMPTPLSSIIAQAIPYRPTTIQQTSGLLFPLIAVWRDKTNVSETNLQSIRMETQLTISYIAPPLTNDQWSKWASTIERVAMLAASLLEINSTQIGNAILRLDNESLAVEQIEYGTFADQTGLELPSAMIRCKLVEIWRFHGFTDDADAVVGIDYSVGNETKPSLVEVSQTFGD